MFQKIFLEINYFELFFNSHNNFLSDGNPLFLIESIEMAGFLPVIARSLQAFERALEIYFLVTIFSVSSEVKGNVSNLCPLVAVS